MNKPECLHIPTLYEGENAEISWGAMETDTNYILERVFNRTFSQELSGSTWDNIDTSEKTWSQYDQQVLNWSQIEAEAGKGRHWERIDYDQLSWSQIDNNAQTWKQLESRDISFEIFKGVGEQREGVGKGRAWLEFDGQEQSWNSLEQTGHTWDAAESVILPGLSWESIDAKWLTSDEWQGKDLTFHELELQNQVEKHRGMTDYIPIGAVNAMYRLSASASNGDISDYLTTLQLPVVPVFYRNSEVKYPVMAGRRYQILMRAEQVCGLDKVRMNLIYNPYLLKLTNFVSYSSGKIVEPGDYPEYNLRIYSHVPGKVWFQSTQPVEKDKSYSGPIMVAEFTARDTGIASITLS